MRNVLIALAIVLGLAACVQAAGEVPEATLADLGLGGMQQVSDVQGEQIRGKWYFDISFDFHSSVDKSKWTYSRALSQYLTLNGYSGTKVTAGSWDNVDLLNDGHFLAEVPTMTGGVMALVTGNNGFAKENDFAKIWRQNVLKVNQTYNKYYPKGIGAYGPRPLGLKPIW